MTRLCLCLAISALLLAPAAASGKKLKLEKYTARGSAVLSLDRPTSARKLPPFGNTWAWPQGFPKRGGVAVPDSVLCSLLTVATPGDTHVPGLIVDWRIDLIKDDATIFSAQGRSLTEKRTLTFSESLEDLEIEIETPDLVQVEFEFQNAKQLSFARLDCYAIAVAPAD